MINTVMGWFEILQYKDKQVVEISNLVENTWLTRYPWPIEIKYNQGSEFIVHDFKNCLIKE